MIVQWCCKGVGDLPSRTIWGIFASGAGLKCRLWQLNSPLKTTEVVDRLTELHLDLHVNQYGRMEPGGKLVRDVTPFLSLSAGCVTRSTLLRTNVLHRAQRTALGFATNWGRDPGWLFTCYVLVSVNRAVGVQAVAEETRELNHGRRYSPYFTEGEITAKVNVPANQIIGVERWVPTGSGSIRRIGGYLNGRFAPPAALLDERRML